MKKVKCPRCQELRDSDYDFQVLCDGRWLRTRECRFCLRAADVEHNREQRKKMRL